MGLPQPNGYLDPDVFLEWEKTQLEKYEYLDGQVVQVYAMVAHAERGDRIRIMSARELTRREREQYESGNY